MGGLALAHCTRRFDAGEYYEIAEEVLQKLQSIFPRSKVSVIKSYKGKPSFGDLDVLLESDHLPMFWVDRVADIFNSKDSTKNGNVLSVEYREMQVDVIAIPSEQFETSVNYFGFNDLGNLLGRISHSLGMKLGHDGLSYSWRTDDYLFKTVVISTDWKVICEVLGVSYERYCEGFDELEDIFKFVVSSPFFNRDIYLLHNRNNYARTRDKKRKTYTEFLKWIETYEHTEAQVFHMVSKDKFGKSVFLPKLLREIPGFKETYDIVQAEWVAATEFKKRYNGDIVKEVTGLDGIALGQFMRWMKDNLDQEGMKKGILSFNPEVVPRWIAYWYAMYKSIDGRSLDEFNGDVN